MKQIHIMPGSTIIDRLMVYIVFGLDAWLIHIVLAQHAFLIEISGLTIG